MADFPYFPLWTDSYLADTTHLSDCEHGRYMLLLIHLWRMPERRFPNDDEWLARKFNRPVDRVKSELRPLIKEFFKSDGNWITHKRVEKEFERCAKTSQRQSDAAKSRWGKEKAQCHGNAAPAMQPEPDPDSKNKKETGFQRNPCRPEDDHVVDSLMVAVNAYNATARKCSLPVCMGLSSKRRHSLKARIREIGIDKWVEAMNQIESIPFLCGKNNRGWTASIDFLLQQDSVTKILEGFYTKGGHFDKDIRHIHEHIDGQSKTDKVKAMLDRYQREKYGNGQTGSSAKSFDGVPLRIPGLSALAGRSTSDVVDFCSPPDGHKH